MTASSGTCNVQPVKTLLRILRSCWRLTTPSAAQPVFQAISIFINFLDTFLILHLKMLSLTVSQAPPPTKPFAIPLPVLK